MVFIKSKYKSLFTAKDYWMTVKHPPKIPSRIILAYQHDIVKNLNGIYYKDLGATLYLLNGIGLVKGFGVGGAAVATIMEELIALGAKQFISIGTAGSLKTTLAIGDFVLCSGAIRGDGVSINYLSDSKYSYPSNRLNRKIQCIAKSLKVPIIVGRTWTTAVLYRETKQEIIKYKNEVLTVDMEAATIFAVAKYHNVEASVIFTISDYCGLDKWEAHFSKTMNPLNNLLNLAKCCLLNKS